jgi:inner membrane protein involved in colicin E2 resistance
MQRILGSKILMIGLLILCFLIAFMFIRGTIYERQANHQQVIRDIARSNVSAQTSDDAFYCRANEYQLCV